MQVLVKDSIKKTSPLPRNFRDVNKLDFTKLSCNTTGLDKLNCVASGQYTPYEFALAMMKYQAKNIWVLDLRMESHFFVDNKSYSWFDKQNAANKGKNLTEIFADQQAKITNLKQHAKFKYYKAADIVFLGHLAKSKSRKVHNIETEEDFLKARGCNYVRLPVLDHNRPSDDIVQQFLDLKATLPANVTLYFHCKGGMGRATTFMVMNDILTNPDVPLTDIIKRQAEIGKKDLLDMSTYVGVKSYQKQAALERLEFVSNFYEYVQQNRRQPLRWHEYIAQHQAPTLNALLSQFKNYRNVESKPTKECRGKPLSLSMY